MKSVPVCRVCDEIMADKSDAVGVISWSPRSLITKLGLILVLWVTFQTGLGFSELNDDFNDPPASVPILFVIISVFLLLLLPKLVNNLQSESKSSRKPRIITLVVWIVVLATFLIYAIVV